MTKRLRHCLSRQQILKTRIRHTEKTTMRRNQSRSPQHWRSHIYIGLCVSLAGLLCVATGLTDTTARNAAPTARRAGDLPAPGLEMISSRTSRETSARAGATGLAGGDPLSGAAGSGASPFGPSSKPASITTVSNTPATKSAVRGKSVMPMAGSTITVTTTADRRPGNRRLLAPRGDLLGEPPYQYGD
jgi:hypothetical protein